MLPPYANKTVKRVTKWNVPPTLVNLPNICATAQHISQPSYFHKSSSSSGSDCKDNDILFDKIKSCCKFIAENPSTESVRVLLQKKNAVIFLKLVRRRYTYSRY